MVVGVWKAQKINVYIVSDAVSNGIWANTIAQGAVGREALSLRRWRASKQGPTERKAGPGRQTKYAAVDIKEIENATTRNPHQSMAEVDVATDVSATTARGVVREKTEI